MVGGSGLSLLWVSGLCRDGTQLSAVCPCQKHRGQSVSVLCVSNCLECIYRFFGKHLSDVQCILCLYFFSTEKLVNIQL